MKTNKKNEKSPRPRGLLSPEQALGRRRLRKLTGMVKALRAVCQRKIYKFCGKPIEIPIDAYLPDAVDIVEKELKAMNWVVTRHSGLEGDNPIIRLAMR